MFLNYSMGESLRGRETGRHNKSKLASDFVGKLSSEALSCRVQAASFQVKKCTNVSRAGSSGSVLPGKASTLVVGQD